MTPHASAIPIRLVQLVGVFGDHRDFIDRLVLEGGEDRVSSYVAESAWGGIYIVFRSTGHLHSTRRAFFRDEGTHKKDGTSPRPGPRSAAAKRDDYSPMPYRTTNLQQPEGDMATTYIRSWVLMIRPLWILIRGACCSFLFHVRVRQSFSARVRVRVRAGIMFR